MAKKADFQLNVKGLNELMKSSGMENALMEAAQNVVNAGDFDASVHKASFVSIANIYTAGAKSYYDNQKNNTLLVALSNSGLPMTK